MRGSATFPRLRAALAAFHPTALRRPAPLSWSFRLGSLAGVDLYLHGSFLLLLALFAASGLGGGQGVGGVLRSLAMLLAVFGMVVLHELGHALMARRFGIRTWDITLLPIGGVARLERLPEQPTQQILVALAGPATSLALAGLLFGLVRFLDAGGNLALPRSGGWPLLGQLAWINASLAAFNLLPGFPMDGGRVLRAVLAMRLRPEAATQLAARIGQATAVVLAVLGLFSGPLLVFVAVFVWFGAQAEHSASRQRTSRSQLSVRDAMTTRFQTLAALAPLTDARELAGADGQQDFPVLDGTRPVGLITRDDVERGLAEYGAPLLVRQAMGPGLQTARPDEKLERVLQRMRYSGRRVLMVVAHDRVVGLLRLDGDGEPAPPEATR